MQLQPRSALGGTAQRAVRRSAYASQQPPPFPAGSPAAAAQARRDLAAAVARLPGLEGVLPGAGDAAAKQALLGLISELERSEPFRPQAPGAAAALVGEWQLLFASDGTVVTRSPPAQALAALQQAAGSVPGVGLRDIRQALTTPGDGQAGAAASGAGAGAPGGGAQVAAAGAGLSCSNAVSIGLGPFGTWEVRALGHWSTTHEPAWRFSGGSPRRAAGGAAADAPESGLASEVSFDGVGVRLQGFFGLELGQLLPEFKVKVPRRPPSTRPNWETTYCDGEWRVGRGESGGIFLFRKRLQ